MYFIDGRYDEETQTCKLYFLSWLGGEGDGPVPPGSATVCGLTFSRTTLQATLVVGAFLTDDSFTVRSSYRQTAIVLPSVTYAVLDFVHSRLQLCNN